MLKQILISMRPAQWTKNLVIFAGLVFSRNVAEPVLLARSVAAVVLFCLLSGAVYLVNDIADLKEDRRHPEKSLRPIASGKLSPPVAWASALVIVLASLLLAFFLSFSLGWTALLYFLMMLAYSFVLKHMVIVDVLAVSIGFVLRAVAGGVVIGVEISFWLLLCTILLALFLALSKRRYELVRLDSLAAEHRPSLGDYSPALLDQMISVVTASTVLAYALYTESQETLSKFHTRNLGFTIPFVLYGIFRYLYLVYQKQQGGSPEKILLKDRALLIDIVLWILVAGFILYVP